MNEEYYKNVSKEEQEFLDDYSPGDFERPSVTADIVIFTVNPQGMLCAVFIQRKDFPYKDCWALPGGFLRANDESVEQTAVRELNEETGLNNVFLQQLKTYSDPGRDPRMHVISVAHYALVPYSKIKLFAGDDAKDCSLFECEKMLYSTPKDNVIPGFFFKKNLFGEELYLTPQSFAFDHYQIVYDAIYRVHGRINYTSDLFDLLENDQSFTIPEFQKCYDAFSFKQSDPANFRKMFNSRFLKTGLVMPIGKKTTFGRPTELYRLVKEDM